MVNLQLHPSTQSFLELLTIYGKSLLFLKVTIMILMMADNTVEIKIFRYSDGLVPTKVLDIIPFDTLHSTGGLPCKVGTLKEFCHLMQFDKKKIKCISMNTMIYICTLKGLWRFLLYLASSHVRKLIKRVCACLYN